jgi:hypothetical protein
MKKCFLVLVVILLTTSIKAQEERLFKVGCIAFYNVENLFDTIDDPNKNDAEFLPDGSYRWSSKRYHQKLERLAEVIAGIGTEYTPDGPAILGLSEIENKAVIEELVLQPEIRSRNYQVIHYDSPDRRGVDVGLIYQPKYFQPTNSKSYTLKVEGMDDFFTRDQLVVSGLFDGEPMHFIVGHWPSRRGGEKRSLPLRVAAGALSRHIADSILQLDKDAKIVVMGDLNDNPTNKSVADALKAKGSSDKLNEGDLYNPMYALYKKGIGSNAWRDSWSLFDQMIVSQGLLGNDYDSYRFRTVKVYNKVEMTQRSGRFKGYPWRTYVGSEYHGGYSDHFPAYIIVVKEVEK